MGLFARQRKRRHPEPVRTPLPDLRRPRWPQGGFEDWTTEMEAFATEAEERASNLPDTTGAFVTEALVRYFDGGDNDPEQQEMLLRMVRTAVKLGHGYAAVERVLGVAEASDPRILEMMARVSAPGATGFPAEASRVLGVCLDVGYLVAKVPSMEESFTFTLLRNAGTERAREVAAEMRAKRA